MGLFLSSESNNKELFSKIGSVKIGYGNYGYDCYITPSLHVFVIIIIYRQRSSYTILLIKQ